MCPHASWHMQYKSTCALRAGAGEEGPVLALEGTSLQEPLAPGFLPGLQEEGCGCSERGALAWCKSMDTVSFGSVVRQSLPPPDVLRTFLFPETQGDCRDVGELGFVPGPWAPQCRLIVQVLPGSCQQPLTLVCLNTCMAVLPTGVKMRGVLLGDHQGLFSSFRDHRPVATTSTAPVL